MKNRFSYIRFVIVLAILQFSAAAIARAQENTGYGKTAISFNLTRMATSEYNISLERFLSSRRSIEFNFGLIYKNEFLSNQVNDWTNADALFAEEGFAARIHYKIFKRQETDSKWKDYIAIGIVYKNLHYTDLPGSADFKPDFLFNDSIIGRVHSNDGLPDRDTSYYTPIDTVFYAEKFLQKRDREQYGIQFLWGKVYEINRTFAFEFYFGAGLDATIATRTDYSRYATYHTKVYTYVTPSTPKDLVKTVTDDNKWRNQSVPDFTDDSFYLRPNVQAGIKFRIRF